MIGNSITPTAAWEADLAARLPLFGHRNWIVVADAAYPAQSSSGIETIAAEASQARVLRSVIQSISVSAHIRANVHVDQELTFVQEQDAPGVEQYRQELAVLLPGSAAVRMPHEQIIAKLDQAARMFRILILKTQMTIPYTSVFFELDCGYWNGEAEQRLRRAMTEAHAQVAR
jgi:L-fucose mutarotase/ribose pyranase (RbsD/FucU family)